MIAIAGSKGGVGKTTTTLGLAEAFGRAGVPTLVIDADRQLPNLHVAADVPREPTIADLKAGMKVADIAHTHPDPECPFVKILPAPLPGEAVDLSTLLPKLQNDRVQILIDCPAGVGPDATDPLCAADETVVVSTMTKQSLEAASKTIEIADRLEVDVHGVLLNKCDHERAAVADQLPFPAPLLETVPECASPITNSSATRVYNAVITDYLDRTVSTGIPALDGAFDGGFPAGSVIDLTADPDARSELLLYALTASRNTLYITTEKSEQLTFDLLSSSAAPTNSPVIKHVSGENALEDATRLVQSLPPECNLVVDPIDVLEQYPPAAYLEFLNTLVDRMHTTDGLALLHAPDRPGNERNRSSTKQFADVVASCRLVDSTATHPASPGEKWGVTGSDGEKAPARASVTDGGSERASNPADDEQGGATNEHEVSAADGPAIPRESLPNGAHQFSIVTSRSADVPIQTVTLAAAEFFEAE